MFDISFSELLVIAIVALVVIGPEKLPKVARTAGAFFGRLQRFVAQVKDEVNRESRFAELQKLQQEVQSSMQQHYTDIERSILPSEPLAEPVEAEFVESQTAEADIKVDAVKPATVKKPRKPRAAKSDATAAEKTSSTPRRRSKAATSESASAGTATESAPPAAVIAPEAVKTARRSRKPKPKAGGDTTDMFEPQS